jgi:hypothetical protein
MSTLERAQSGYDDQHEDELVSALLAAILKASTVSDVSAIVLRTAEIGRALETVLAGILALSPGITRSPTTIRTAAEAMRKRLIRRVSEAATDPDLMGFRARCFNNTDEGGHA